MRTTGTLSVTTPDDRQIVLTRIFDAPRNQVWDAMTRPELLRRWLSGPPGWSMADCENDLRVGGAFRCVWSAPGNTGMTMRGIYREVVPPERIVRTESFDFGCNLEVAGDGKQVATLILDEPGGGGGGKSTLTLSLLYPSTAARDAALASGLEPAMAAGYDCLDALLAATAAQRDSRTAA